MTQLQPSDIAVIEEHARSTVEEFLRNGKWYELVKDDNPRDSSGHILAVTDKRDFVRRMERDQSGFVQDLKEKLARYEKAGKRKHKQRQRIRMLIEYANEEYMPLDDFFTGATEATYLSGHGWYHFSITDVIERWADEIRWNLAKKEVMPNDIKVTLDEYSEVMMELEGAIADVYCSDRFEVVTTTVDKILRSYTFPKIQKIVRESTSFLDAPFSAVLSLPSEA